ncbi:hypothetical protein [Candidatus Mycoplasma mahonii]|uniref:hypothetical protein n=1 Tax=Candidatus Mycoplasma mahonii TaxID=3004105 RepID=UPI0026EEB36B|nr:hypothetical protein [Candidatus Mycoplasma mahonii]WKX02671.1 hypothetical protein O3I44_01160 [Candidatus Mycoplasma mahonii]
MKLYKHLALDNAKEIITLANKKLSIYDVSRKRGISNGKIISCLNSCKEKCEEKINKTIDKVLASASIIVSSNTNSKEIRVKLIGLICVLLNLK